jgi:acyl-CoA reductase-like NAD-dependent aldehyde dehydrogenase
MSTEYPYYLANKPHRPNTALAVRNKFDHTTAAYCALADRQAIDRAIAAAVEAAPQCRRMPAYARSAVLNHVVECMAARHEELATTLAIEAGKTIRDSRGEIARGIDTFRIAAEEATRIGGEYMPLDVSPRAHGYEGIWKRVPVGPCAFISPFNFPINLAAHKIAPAIAAGCPFVLKPASHTPIGALILGEILAETDLPDGSFSILPCRREDGDALVEDDRLKLLSFTGSPTVGWALKNRAGKKKVVLELGGNAACIVDAGSDVDATVQRLVIGAFYQSGQSCISVQRILVHASLYERLRDRLIAATSALIIGDPLREDTFLGPLITVSDAERIVSWIDEAVTAGAHLLCGGQRDGALMQATLLERVPDSARLSCAEAFGPVAILEPFEDFAAACQRVNDSAFGLQAGVFTNDIDSAFYAFNELEVGGVVINDVPSFRVDNMPYGGVKDSGLGREGLRFAIEDMTERRLMVLRNIGRSSARRT